jgi:N-acetylglucosaminyl-diphospho-decaprenol L-rhamnosyltransferase
MPPTKRESRIAPPPESGHGPHLAWPNASSTAERCADLDVGLVYTYERAYLDTLLPQLSHSGDAIRLRLILVDNASTDGVQAWQNLFPAQATVRNGARLGYAANLNRILEASSAPYVLLLNSDMEFDPREQCLARMVSFMDEHPRCGLSTCGVYHRDGAYAYPARRWQTPRIVLARRLRMFGQGRRVVDEYLYRDRAATETFPCDWVSGCFMLVRRAAIAEVGAFDTRFGKYFEDVDMCRRMHRAGWNVMHHGATRCVHFEQRASRRLFSRDAARHAAAYVRWLWKWRRG